ncbi:MAG TPA: choice-of-anchor B family protein [Gemmatimonadales bacterium]|nr:choice-of-anchor B family protein [Gemmatimonadales bacterium]
MTRSLVTSLIGAVALAAAPVVHAADAPARAAFGRSLAIAGDFAFVGEPGGFSRPGNPPAEGGVWVFRRGGAGAWQHQATLTLPADVSSSGFGTALAASGNLLLVGHVPPRSFGDDAPPEAPGMVHVYQRGSDGQYSSAGVLPAPATAGSRFGTAVVLEGDLAYVGAPGETGGMVHVYRRTASGWSDAGMLMVDGLDPTAGFGSSISVSGNRIAVGAPGHEGKGAVFMFSRGADGRFTREGSSALVSRRAADRGGFGGSVMLDGDHLLVGAPAANFLPEGFQPPQAPNGRRFGNAGVGMVAFYTRNASSGAWVESGMAMPYDFPTSAGFGTSMARVGDEYWIGAPSSGGTGDIYRLDATGSDAGGMRKLVVDSIGRRGSQLGGAFAVSGSRAILGMPGDVGGDGTVLFLERDATGNWRTVASAFPPVKDRFQMVRGKEVVCAEGEAAQFKCSNTGLLAFLPISQVGGDRGSRMSDNWGWTDPETGREYALAGRNDGTAFVDITDPENPRYLGNLPLTPGANPAAWRDMKTYKNHVYVVADGSGQHGMQVFDLTRLRNVRTPQVFEPDYLYTNIASAHNIVINEETGFAYSVGGSAGGEQCGGGLHMIDIRNPGHPVFAGCAADGRTGRRGTGYSHDAVCIVYRGPDAKYQGHEICVGSNETAISVQDVTDKSSPVFVSSASYPFVSYAHQGWFTEDHKYFYLDDESDEIAAQRDTTGQNKAKLGTRTMVYDMTDLDDPVLVNEYIGTVRSSDHNLYVRGNKMYLANYGSGLRIADISDPVNPREVAYLDTYPDDENQPQMVGAWSTYPFFKSGTIIVTSVSEGLFLIKDRSQAVP